jgi:hypothetical protein
VTCALVASNMGLLADPHPHRFPVVVAAAEPSMEARARRRVVIERERRSSTATGPLKSALVRDIAGSAAASGIAFT